MANKPPAPAEAKNLSRKELIDLLNEDLAREYQAIIAYVVYSQVLKGAQYMNIAGELELHAKEELAHALIDRQADRLPGWHAGGDAQAGQDLGQGRRHAPLRPGQRERDDPKLPRFACASARRWASMPSPSRSGRSWSRNKSTRSTWRPRWAWMCRTSPSRTSGLNIWRHATDWPRAVRHEGSGHAYHPDTPSGGNRPHRQLSVATSRCGGRCHSWSRRIQRQRLGTSHLVRPQLCPASRIVDVGWARLEKPQRAVSLTTHKQAHERNNEVTITHFRLRRLNAQTSTRVTLLIMVTLSVGSRLDLRFRSAALADATTRQA